MFGWNEKGETDSLYYSDDTGSLEGLLITGQTGFVSGMRVASNLGWCAVDTLCVGDRVLTFDNGMQRVVDIQRETLWTMGQNLPLPHAPVFVPKGALANRKDLWLMADQGLLVECEAAHDVLGDPFVVIPANALVGFHGIVSKAPPKQLVMTVLSFASDEVIYVEGGMLAYCPRPRCILTDDPEMEDALYEVLPRVQAKSVVANLIENTETRAFVCHPEEVAALP